MIGEGLLEIDESLLTGEADLIRKQPGSGFFPVVSASLEPVTSKPTRWVRKALPTKQFLL